MLKKNLSHLLIAVTALSLVLIANGLILAWVPPTANPPSGNTSAPLNISDVDQTKSGKLTVGGLNIGGGLPYWLTKVGDSFVLKNNAGVETFTLGQDGNAILSNGGLSATGGLFVNQGAYIGEGITMQGGAKVNLYNNQYDYNSSVWNHIEPRCSCDSGDSSIDCSNTFVSLFPSSPEICYDWYLVGGMLSRSRKFISAKSTETALEISSDSLKPALTVEGINAATAVSITGNTDFVGSVNVANDLTVTGNFTDNRCSWILLASGSDITEEAQIVGDFKNGSVDMSNTITYYGETGQKININSIAKIAHPEKIRSIAFEASNPEDSFCMGGTGEVKLGVNGQSGTNTKCTRTQYNGKTYDLKGIDEKDWIKLALEDINGWEEQVNCYNPSMKEKYENNSGTYGGTYIGGFEDPNTNPTSHGVTGMCQSFYKLYDGSVSYDKFDNLTGKFKVLETDHSPYKGVWNWKIWGNYCNYEEEEGSIVLYSGKHLESDCENAGGTAEVSGTNDWICRLSGSACPSGWTSYSEGGQLWSTTKSTTCNVCEKGHGCAGGLECTCVTASHNWSAMNSETCKYGYYIPVNKTCPWYICTAERIEIGCY